MIITKIQYTFDDNTTKAIGYIDNDFSSEENFLLVIAIAEGKHLVKKEILYSMNF